MKDLVLIGMFPEDLQAKIDQEFRCHTLESVLSHDALRSRVEGIITRSNATVPPEVLSSLPNLKIIATSGVGFDGIPVEVARAKAVVVTNTPGVLDAAVCELGIGLLLALLRKIPEAERHLRDGHWRTEAFPLTTSLAGKSVGIVGLGRIGRGVAARLVPFDASISYTDRREVESPYRYVVNLLDLAAEVDILFLCVPGGPETGKLIDASVLRALGPDGFLINIARGAIIDEAALIHALQTGLIKGAALDVFEDEPMINPAFQSLPNTVLTPHVGSATKETREVMLRLTLANLHAVLGGAPALTPV